MSPGGVVLAGWLVIAACSPSVPPLSGPRRGEAAPGPSDADQSLAYDILRWAQVERLRAGVPPLVWSEKLALAARRHSEEMVRLHYFAHDSPVAEHRTVMMRAKLAGLDGSSLFVGENLAKGNWPRERARRLVEAWMRSPGHRANLLRAEFQHTGIGLGWDGAWIIASQVFSASP